MSKKIENLGFDKWFQDNTDPDGLEGLEIARVTAVHKDSYTVTNGKQDVFAEPPWMGSRRVSGGRYLCRGD